MFGDFSLQFTVPTSEQFKNMFQRCLGLEPRTFWAQSQQRRRTDLAASEISHDIISDLIGQCLIYSDGSFVLNLKNLPKTKLRGY
jgi:hypothetical protein